MKHLLIALVLAACGHKDESRAPEPTKVAEAAPAHDATAEFWSWFSANAPRLHEEKDLEHVMNEINEHLEPSHAGIFVEIGVEGSDRELVISADGKKELFPLVQKVFAARPTVGGWKIVAFRQRDPEFELEMGGIKLDPKKIRFTGERDGDKMSVELFVPGYDDSDPMKQALFVMLDHTVGEYDMETKIGGIDFAALAKAPASAKTLTELPALLDKTFAK
jgi:hypothetical protein